MRDLCATDAKSAPNESEAVANGGAIFRQRDTMAKMSAGVTVSNFEHNLGDSGEAKLSANRSWHLGWRWGALGLVGSVLMTLAGPLLSNHGSAHWWFLISIPPGRTGDTVAEYAGVVLLCAAWLGLGRRLLHEPLARPGELWVLGVIWSVPLALGPALYSGDMYSYLAEGTILHVGLDPYHVAPAVLAHLGHSRVLDAVSPFWRHTTAPYGPLFLGIMSILAGVTGSHLVAGVLLARAVEVVGIALLAVFVPRLATSFGSDPCRATWLAVISPLVLVELVSAGHNDALMAGLMVAGVALARERHPLLAVALCALAATVKVPAEVAVLFIVVSWARALPSRTARLRFCAAAVAIAVVVPVAVSVATGLGIGWISTTLLSTPGKVHLAITPVTAVAWTVARLAHAVGVMVSRKALEAAFGNVALAGTALLGVALLWRETRQLRGQPGHRAHRGRLRGSGSVALVLRLGTRPPGRLGERAAKSLAPDRHRRFSPAREA